MHDCCLSTTADTSRDTFFCYRPNPVNNLCVGSFLFERALVTSTSAAIDKQKQLCATNVYLC